MVSASFANFVLLSDMIFIIINMYRYHYKLMASVSLLFILKSKFNFCDHPSVEFAELDKSDNLSAIVVDDQLLLYYISLLFF